MPAQQRAGSDDPPDPQKLSSLVLVNVYVRGQAQFSLGFDASPGAQAGADTDAGVLCGRRLLGLTDPGRYPRITTAVTSGSLDDGSDFATSEFAFGLNTVLDGMAARITRPAADTHDASTSHAPRPAGRA